MVVELKSVYAPAQMELVAVEAEMYVAVSTLTPLLQDAATRFMQAGGKRLRPLLTILAAKLGTSQSPQVVQAAAALELVHLGSLVHDDIVDAAHWRRGQPSINALYGNQVAVLLGDFFFARSLALARRAGTEVVQVISDVISNLVEGELAQLQRSYDVTLTEAEYWERIRRKTASFIGECCRLGAIYSPSNPLTPGVLQDYGLKLGLAYQVKDDLLDFLGNSDVMGKPSLHDLHAGVITLPLIHTLATHPRREELAALIKAENKCDLKLILHYLKEAGSLAFAQQRAAELIGQAKHSLQAAPEVEAKTALLAIADFVLNRVS